MTLAFPHQDDDIRLEQSPLAEVVCQIRFPPILSIPESTPADFQGRIRKRFPYFEPEDSVLFRLEMVPGAQVPSAQQQTASRIYKFISRERESTASLSKDFYALATSHYTVWEEFAVDLQLLADAMKDVYDPSHATRVGLRYINVLEASRLGLNSFSEVVDLLRPELTSLFRTSVWSEPADASVQLVLNDEQDAGRLGFRMRKQLGEVHPSLILDFDYFQESEQGLPLENLVQRCDRYHKVIYDAFRWCIREDRLDVFGPVLKQEAVE